MENNYYLTLKSRTDFLSLFKMGERVHPNSQVILNYQKNPYNIARLGLTVPKYVGTAVRRNKIRRWCKEFFRNSGCLKEFNRAGRGVDINIVFRRGKTHSYKNLSYSFLESTLTQGVKKIKLKAFYVSSGTLKDEKA